MPTTEELKVSTLGPCQVASPLPMSTTPGDGVGNFVGDRSRVLFDIECNEGEMPSPLAFEKAGPRQSLFFDPAKTRAAVVTCGGLCPGINNVIRSLYLELKEHYHIKELLGIRFGYQGLNPEIARKPIRLTSELVHEIHHDGGSMLGTSRGHQSHEVIVDYLQEAGINILFCVGGDGTQCGAHEIAQEVLRRKLPISIVGIPKTIDNDIRYCWRTFGFMTAVAEAELVIDRAHVEAKAVLGGVGLVKLMGRHAGYIAAAATMASGLVNFTLIPEVPIQLEGHDGFLERLRRRLQKKEHAVVVVAEGAGQELLRDRAGELDASGNQKLSDIGPFLKQEILKHCGEKHQPVKVKYIDPSYHIRSVHAGAFDSLLCAQLARNAAHAGMAGKTDVLIGLWHNRFVHVPLAMSAGQIKQLSTESDLWTSVLAATGQERW